MTNEANKIAVTSTEILTIESYIQSKNTAVLTLMFTDIKGFTELTEQKGEVYLVRFYPDAMYLDNSQPIALAGEKTDQSRKVITDIKRGKHIVHYGVTQSDRYYAEMAIDYSISAFG